MSRLFRRAVAAPVVALLATSTVMAVTAAPALADNSSTLTVVGTSDVYDSNLVQSVIKPGFEAANPGITLNYVSKGTGAAIAYAEAGSASALIVHAASLENQFVDQGYSLEDYGRAIFYGDYVLLGPASDPAHVLTGASRDIVTAFERIAATGAKGKANFVSRGGTPGTTVQEHAIWALADGVATCTVSDVNGGGQVPSTTGVGGPCPVTQANPTWYQTTGFTQGPNILAGDTCNFPGGGCYVFTDRGTFQFLRSQGNIHNLSIVTRDNLPSKRGGSTILTNSFHAYGISTRNFTPSVAAGINTVGAQKFLEWITSPPAQDAIGAYLAGDADGAAFLPDAAPDISAAVSPSASVNAGSPVTVSGTVKNNVPGTPVLSGVPVTLTFTPTADPSQTATVTGATNSSGKYSLAFRPSGTGTYVVTTPQVERLEDGALTPKFYDILVGGTSEVRGAVPVKGAVVLNTATGGKGTVVVNATLNPGVKYQTGTLTLLATPTSGTQQTPSISLPIGSATRFNARFTLPAGTYDLQVQYSNDGVITAATSNTVTGVTIR